MFGILAAVNKNEGEGFQSKNDVSEQPRRGVNVVNFLMSKKVVL